MMRAMTNRPRGSTLTRREVLLAGAFTAAACGRKAGAEGWTSAGGRLLIGRGGRPEGPRVAEREGLPTRVLGPQYHYYTRLRNKRVHDLRASADYALALLELK